MPNPIIERAARAASEEFARQNSGVIVGEGGDLLDPAAMARAVLLAIREPSEAMVAAGGNVEWWETIGDNGETVETSLSPDNVQRAWQAMIDAALG